MKARMYATISERNRANRAKKPLCSLMERFWEKVDTSGDCWEWRAARGMNGYGYIGLGTKRHGILAAHKLSFEMHAGREVRHGMVVCHRCSNRACVRPSHLFEGTYRENILQAYAEGAR